MQPGSRIIFSTLLTLLTSLILGGLGAGGGWGGDTLLRLEQEFPPQEFPPLPPRGGGVVLRGGVVPPLAGGGGFALTAQDADSPRAGDIPRLIEGLGDSRFHVREESQRTLISRGTEAIAPLEAAAQSTDPEIAERARLILNKVDPLVVHIRILEIELDRPPRVAEVLEYEGKESQEESKEVLLPESADPEHSVRYAVNYRLLPGASPPQPPRGGDRIELSVDELPVNSMAMRTPLLPASPRWGAVSILKRGEECLYRQMGSHLERERHPFVVTVQWWTERSLKQSARGAAGERGGAAVSARPASPLRDGVFPPRPPGGVDLEGFIGELVAQAESKESRARETAIELLGLLQALEADSVLRAAAGADGPAAGDGEEAGEARDLRLAALIGLARGGDPEARAALRKALTTLSQAPAAPRPEAARPRKGRRMISASKSPSDTGRLSAGFWPTRAALALVEASDPAGFEHFARRIVDVDPADVHLVLAVLADHLDRLPGSCRELLLEGLASPELVLHLPWDDPEVEYFYGRLREIVARPEDRAYRERLLLTLARTLWTDSGLGSTRLRAFSRLWDRMTGGEPASDLAERVLKEVLGSSGRPLPLHELVPWLGSAFRERPIPDEEFKEVLALLRSHLGRSQSLYTAANAAVELARWPALSSDQLVQVAVLLAEVASLPNQPSAQESVNELERLTGLSFPAAARRPARPGAPQAPGAESTIVEQVARWAADADQVRASVARRVEGAGGDATAEPLEYWEFDFLVPYRQARITRGKPPEKPGEPRLLDARHALVRAGVPFNLTSRWGGSVLHRLDPDRSPGAVSLPPKGDATRYRLNWQSVLELDLPAFISLKEEDQTVSWYATSDIRLGASPISKPYSLQHQKLACIRKAGGSGSRSPSPEPAQVWQAFCQDLLESLSSKQDERRSRSVITIIQNLRIREAAGFIRQEFERRPDPSLAQTIADLGDLEFLRTQLGEEAVPRRFHAAQALAAACDRTGLRALLEILRSRPREVTPFINGAMTGLDNFLTNCDPTAAERAEVIDLIVQNLEEGIFQYRGFPLLSREAGIDFKFSQTFQIPQGPARKEAVKRAVDAAREWWSAHRPR